VRVRKNLLLAPNNTTIITIITTTISITHTYTGVRGLAVFYYKITQTRSLRHTFNFVMLSVRVYWVELQGKGFEGARAKVRPEVVQRFQPSSDVNISCDNIYPVHLLQQPALHGTGARACRKPLCHHRCVQLRT
jgi:hypothetical protein